MTTFELAVPDAAGLGVDARVRPDRLGLCCALLLGGLTPSIAMSVRAVEGPVPVHVLVRVRNGGFPYGTAERRLVVAAEALAPTPLTVLALTVLAPAALGCGQAPGAGRSPQATQA